MSEDELGVEEFVCCRVMATRRSKRDSICEVREECMVSILELSDW